MLSKAEAMAQLLVVAGFCILFGYLMAGGTP